MLLGSDAPGSVEPEAGSLALRVRTEERLANARQGLGRNAAAVVADGDNGLALFAGSLNRDRARAVRRIHGIVQDVRPYLIEAAAQRADRRQAAVIVPDDRYILKTIGKNDQGVFNTLV